ncbi:hypothetical protein BHU62_11985 [Serratia marcescens]|uniref:Uncharacterized protein n=1 Tax=Serratia marcescens TaxID=615 RepID=A0A1Q4P0D7_SERMA|nr:hypothetical protein [Serratia marcescens]OKB66582.1 hypothetical protein BHU62_11985 [Serratia marcescens]
MAYGHDARHSRAPLILITLLSLLMLLLLSGCAQEFKPVVTPASTKTTGNGGAPASSFAAVELVPLRVAPTASGATVTPAAVPPGSRDSSRLAQCTRELDALRRFSASKYTRYKTEFDRLTRTGSQYLAVAGGISKDINDLVQPKYQYALTSLCYRIRGDLSAALLNQVNTQ